MPPAHPAAAVAGAGKGGGMPSSTAPDVAVKSPVDAQPFVEESTPAPESQADGGID